MSDSSTTILDSQGRPPTIEPTVTYRANLDSLLKHQPSTANAIERSSVPQGVMRTVGRDGADTFRVPDVMGRLEWFGRTSMPTVSSVETLRAYQADGRNVVLPGILSGCEVVVLMQRLLPHSALFVLEELPWRVKLALHLYDYTTVIEQGRLIFILGPSFEESFRHFFEANPSYLFPIHLITVPQRTPAQITELQNELERLGGAIRHAQMQVLKKQIDRIHQGSARENNQENNEEVRVVLLSNDARQESLQQVERIERAVQALHRRMMRSVPDSPAQCHLIARLRAVDEISANFVLIIDSDPSGLIALLPKWMRIACWYQPGSHIPAVIEPECLSRCLWLVSNARQRAALIQQGLPSGRVQIVAPGADESLMRNVVRVREIEKTRVIERNVSSEIALFADVPDDRPEANGITLPSQKILWNTLCTLVRDNLYEFALWYGQTASAASRGLKSAADWCYGISHGDWVARSEKDSVEWFAAASARCGIEVKDENVRGHFLDSLSRVLIPSALAQSMLTALVGEFHIGLWGRRGHEFVERSGVWRGSMPSGASRVRLFEVTPAVVFLDINDRLLSVVLDALCAGVPVIVFGSVEAWSKRFPAFSELVNYLVFYQNPEQLVGALKRFAVMTTAQQLHEGSSVEGAERTNGVRPEDHERIMATCEYVLKHHTLRHRLLLVLESVCSVFPSS